MILANGNYLLAILPILFTIILFAFYFQQAGWRKAFLQASILWGVATASVTEGLSIFKGLTFYDLILFWLLADILAGSMLYRKIKKEGFKIVNKPFSGLHGFDYFVLFGLVIYVLVTGIIALAAPPNTTDSLIYHMSRIMHWIQNQSVAPYPTNISRQIYIPPWSEYAILQFQLLTGSDHFANCIQWFSFIGSIFGISLIVKELGANTKGQLFASAFCATIPIVILEASSTQTDLTTAFWLVCFIYFGIHFFNSTDKSDIIWIGFSLGLAILTKTTAYLFAFPFALFILVYLLVNWKADRLLYAMLAVAIVITINSGQFIRMYQIYKAPLGPTQVDESKYTNEIFTPAAFASNIVRNVGVNLSTPSNKINNDIENLIEKFHSKIGIMSNDPRTTFANRGFHVKPISLDEDFAGNLLATILAMLLSIYCLLLFRKLPKIINIYVVALWSGFFLFCAVLKWQVWITRLQTPLFILTSAVFGVVASKIKFQFLSKAIVGLLFIAAIPWLVEGQPRPLLGNHSVLTTNRNEQYLSNEPNLYPSYMSVTNQIETMKAPNVGLVMQFNDSEYPLWVYLSNDERPLPRIEHVKVQNETNVIARTNPYYHLFKPDVLVVTIPKLFRKNTLTLNRITYQRIWQSSHISLFARLQP